MAEADPNFPKRASHNRETLDAAHIARSKFIDAFADLESVVAKAMVAAGKDPKLCASFGQRLTAIDNTSPQATELAKVAKCRAEILELSGFRNGLIHGQLELLYRGEDEARAALICFWHVPLESGAAMILPFAELTSKTGRLKQLVNQIGQSLPPSQLNPPRK